MPFCSVKHISMENKSAPWVLRTADKWKMHTTQDPLCIAIHFNVLFVRVCVCVPLCSRTHTYVARLKITPGLKGAEDIFMSSRVHMKIKSLLCRWRIFCLWALSALRAGVEIMSVRSRGTAGATLENTIFLAPPHLHSATYLENPTNSEHIRMGGCTCALPWGLLTFFVRDVMLYMNLPRFQLLCSPGCRKKESLTALCYNNVCFILFLSE